MAKRSCLISNSMHGIKIEIVKARKTNLCVCIHDPQRVSFNTLLWSSFWFFSDAPCNNVRESEIWMLEIDKNAVDEVSRY